jgi:hypothetical protein
MEEKLPYYMIFKANLPDSVIKEHVRFEAAPAKGQMDIPKILV